MLSLLLLPPHGQDFSHSSPAPVWGPSHGRQSYTNHSNVRTSHWLQFFMNSSVWVPFTRCSPSGTDCCSVGPPWHLKPCQQTCSSMCSSLHGSTGRTKSLLKCRLPMGSQPPLGIHLLWCSVLHGLQVDISVPLWTSKGCRGTTCLTMVFFMGCRRISALVPGAPSPPPYSLTLVSAELFLSHSLTPLSHCRVFFFCFLTILSQRHYHHHRWAQPWPEAGPSWSWLALAPLDIGEASSSFSQKPPL